MWHGLATRLLHSVDGAAAVYHGRDASSVSVGWPAPCAAGDGAAVFVWEFGFLDDGLAQRFASSEALLALPMRIGSRTLVPVGNARLSNAGQASLAWEDAISAALERSESRDEFSLELRSPFQCRRGGLGNLAFVPEIVFKQLSRRVSAYSPAEVKDLLEEFSPSKSRLVRLDCATVEFMLRPGVRDRGIVGRVEIAYDSPEGMAGFHLLGLIAPFAGLGAKTGACLGSVRPAQPMRRRRNSSSPDLSGFKPVDFAVREVCDAPSEN
jgi:hypothetical protein